MHTSAYVSKRQHTSAYVSIRQEGRMNRRCSGSVASYEYVTILQQRQHTSAYVSIRPEGRLNRRGSGYKALIKPEKSLDGILGLAPLVNE